MKKFLLILGLGISFLNTIAQTKHGFTKKSSISDWAYLDTSTYKLKYPKDWTLERSGSIIRSEFILYAPKDSSILDFKPNINLIIQDLSQSPMSLKEYSDLSVSQIRSLIQNSEIILNETKKGISGEYQRVIYLGKIGETNLLKFEQFYWVKGNRAYVLTYTNKVDEFGKFKLKAESIFNNFLIK